MRAISPAQNVKESQRSNSGRPTREKERKSTYIDRPREYPTDNANRSRSQGLCGGQFIMADKVFASCNYCEMSTILLSVPTSNHKPLQAQCDSWGAIWVEKPGRIFCFKGAEQTSSIKIWNGGKCVPFEISFSFFLKRLDTNHLE